MYKHTRVPLCPEQCYLGSSVPGFSDVESNEKDEALTKRGTQSKFIVSEPLQSTFQRHYLKLDRGCNTYVLERSPQG